MDPNIWFWVWLGLAIILSVAEIFTAGFFMLPFGIGAAVAAMLEFFFPGSIGGSGRPSSASPQLLLIVLRRIANRITHDSPIGLAGNRLIGKQGVVIERLDPQTGPGRVRVEREEWRAELLGHDEPVEVGSYVEVTARRGYSPQGKAHAGADQEQRVARGGTMDGSTVSIVLLGIFLSIFAFVYLAAAIKIVRPYQKGVVERLGKYQRTLRARSARHRPLHRPPDQDRHARERRGRSAARGHHQRQRRGHRRRGRLLRGHRPGEAHLQRRELLHGGDQARPDQPAKRHRRDAARRVAHQPRDHQRDAAPDTRRCDRQVGRARRARRAAAHRAADRRHRGDAPPDEGRADASRARSSRPTATSRPRSRAPRAASRPRSSRRRARATAIKEIAEAEKFQRIAIAEGEAQAIENVFGAIHRGDPTSDLLAVRYLEALPKIADGKATKIFMPLRGERRAEFASA